MQRHVAEFVACTLLAGALVAGAASATVGTTPTASWAWSAGIPGQRTAVPEAVHLMAARFGVQADVVNTVVATPAGAGLLKVLAAQGSTGDVCISATFDGDASSFRCLASESSNAVVFFANDGGARAGEVSWASVAGVARSDVASVRLDLFAGGQADLPLNGWRAFAFSASSREDIPIALHAFRADGTEVSSFDLRGLASAPSY